MRCFRHLYKAILEQKESNCTVTTQCHHARSPLLVGERTKRGRQNKVIPVLKLETPSRCFLRQHTHPTLPRDRPHHCSPAFHQCHTNNSARKWELEPPTHSGAWQGGHRVLSQGAAPGMWAWRQHQSPEPRELTECCLSRAEQQLNLSQPGDKPQPSGFDQTLNPTH